MDLWLYNGCKNVLYLGRRDGGIRWENRWLYISQFFAGLDYSFNDKRRAGSKGSFTIGI
jgi:hypothetical protein